MEKSKSVLSFTQSLEKLEKEEDPLSPPKSLSGQPSEESKSGWVEHTWSTFIERAEEDVEETPQGKLLLSSFQRKKFIHFFYHVLDLNVDHVISQEDFDGLNSRVRHYMDWSKNNPMYLTLNEVHSLFIEYFLVKAVKFEPTEDGFDFGDKFDEVDEDDSYSKDSVSIDEWVDVWGETVGRARKINDLPIWLQYYPKTLFDTINRSASGTISKKELKLFYTAFLDAGKLGDEALTELTEKSYNAMTANGDVELCFHMYKLSFLNFLLGKQPNGPGQFMFGTVTCDEGPNWVPDEYKTVKVAEERETSTALRLEQKSKRKSVMV